MNDTAALANRCPTCISCGSENGHSLQIHSFEVEYFRCRDCGHIWILRRDGTTRDITRRKPEKA